MLMRGGNSRMNHQSAEEEVDDIGDEDVDGEFGNEDLGRAQPLDFFHFIYFIHREKLLYQTAV